jgi:hypothetical protein
MMEGAYSSQVSVKTNCIASHFRIFNLNNIIERSGCDGVYAVNILFILSANGFLLGT